MSGINQPQGLGINQAWQDVTGSRSAGVTYYNTGSSSIAVIASSYNTITQNCVISATVDGLGLGANGDSNGVAGGAYANTFFVVSPSKGYSVTWNGSQNKWVEYK